VAHTLVLVRHGESTWNAENLFTGWYDADLSERGVREAVTAGHLLREAAITPEIVHTSLLVRAIRTANLTLDEMDLLWLPVRRSWRLNERHYGDLTGKNKKETAEEFGTEQVMLWRRSYDVPPPPVDRSSQYHPGNDPRYRDLAPDVLPASECLKDVLERVLPWWYDVCIPDLRAGLVVMVSAHGNSLRALVKHLDGISDEEIPGLNIPTGIPLVYELDESSLRPVVRGGRYLDPDAAAAGAAAVAAQAG
jgi:2,3-bisphosphoglycerate-dependent phosphoglycerate mutase